MTATSVTVYSMNSCEVFLRCVGIPIVTVLLTFIADSSLDHIRGSKFLFVILDNATHALIGAFIWICACVINNEEDLTLLLVLAPSNFIQIPRYNIFWEGLLSALIGSLLDVDHFIAARSFSLFKATHLSHRPFGHAVITSVLLSLVAALSTGRARMGLLAGSACGSHLLRDGVRRGLWLWPLPSTPPLPYSLYLCILATWPWMVALALRRLFASRLQEQTHLHNRHIPPISNSAGNLLRI